MTKRDKGEGGVQKFKKIYRNFARIQSNWQLTRSSYCYHSILSFSIKRTNKHIELIPADEWYSNESSILNNVMTMNEVDEINIADFVDTKSRHVR